MIASVLVPSYQRPLSLKDCLQGLARQSRLPDEAIVVWQGDDVATRSMAEGLANEAPFPLVVLHLAEPGIVPAENLALERSHGDVVLLIDDDAVPPPDWLAKHLAFYERPEVGAVGGPADNRAPDGTWFPLRAKGPIGGLTWDGRFLGNMYDHPKEWRARPPQRVDHLVGYNLSFRRAALVPFEAGLRPYWKLFEADACLGVARRGWEVWFDFSNVVEHRPTNRAYAGGRDGDLRVKVENAAYNHAFVLAKWTRGAPRFAGMARLFLWGSPDEPGPLAWPLATIKHGAPLREARIVARTWSARRSGWQAGREARAKSGHFGTELPPKSV